MALPDNNNLAFVFPGIGVRPFGKEHLFCRRYNAQMTPFLKQGGDYAGVSLLEALDTCSIMKLDQLAREIFAFSFSCGTFEVLRDNGMKPKILAGHSLGIYAALYTTGAISFADGLEIIAKANQLGRNNCGREKFGVGVIIGLTAEEISQWLKKEGLVSVSLANHNSHSSGVYVGYLEEVEKLMKWAEITGAVKVIRLRIDIPFHSPFMSSASKELKDFLLELTWSKPLLPILSALDHSLLSEPADLLEMTAANLSFSIDWPGVMMKLHDLGIEHVVECGAGVSLTQHSRFIEPAPRHYNLKNLRRRLGY